MRKGFSLIELIFVMVVLGIVSSVTAEIFVNTATTSLLQRAKHNSAEKAELALEQLSNRLLYRMDLSLRAKKINGDSLPLDEMNALTPNRDDYVGLEWIAYDNDGFASQAQPGWSGFIDLGNPPAGNTNFAQAESTGSVFALENTIMTNKTGGNGNAAIMFLDTPTYRNDGSDISYTTDCMYAGANGCMFPVTLAGNIMTFNGGDRVAGEMVYSEFYQLATSAYTARAEPNANTGLFDIILYSNYQPWLGETFANGNREVLAQNVKVFRYILENRTIRMKICIEEKIKNKRVSSCREKAVIR